MTALRILIIDDERYACELLLKLLSRMDGTDVVGVAENGVAGLDAIRRLSPDLVFLDVQMPGLTGIDISRQLDAALSPALIFVTAYARYAVEAFEVSAVDYVLKPYSDDRLRVALARARTHLQARESVRVVSQLQGIMSRFPVAPSASTGAYLQRIPVELRGQMRVINVDDVDYITSSGVYAELHAGQRSHLIRDRLQNLELRLDPERFFRIHRSAIVQLSRIDALERHAGSEYLLRLKNGVQLTVARGKVEELERLWVGTAESVR